MHNIAATFLTIITVGIITHVVSTFSVLGHIILGSSAMGEAPVIPDESSMTPSQLSKILTAESHIHRLTDVKVNQQYMRNTEEQQELRTYLESLKVRHPGLSLSAALEDQLE